jgi:hypothetical protein
MSPWCILSLFRGLVVSHWLQDRAQPDADLVHFGNDLVTIPGSYNVDMSTIRNGSQVVHTSVRLLASRLLVGNLSGLAGQGRGLRGAEGTVRPAKNCKYLSTALIHRASPACGRLTTRSGASQRGWGVTATAQNPNPRSLTASGGSVMYPQKIYFLK